ncbi:NAD(P)/FAD-dependent oxidoreductase [Egicoccus sp. AB-alg2]|uniref:NAD(P)/FAD-dependent oxidoreductase n=1 Tax=Egicoccus sp. AB-alg2 TaxID=3242693 RepID=UPI00359EEEB3
MDEHFDAIVVGARVAGAATAMLLARAGQRVLVLDRARPGSDTLSTHAFMRGGVVQLSRWGLLDDVVAAGTPPVRRTVIRYGRDEEVVAIRPAPHTDALYAPRRTVLDPILVDAAARAGAEVRFESTVDRLLRDADGAVTGVEARDARGRRIAARAPITIGADGLRSRVAREVGALTYHQGTNASAMVVGYWAGLDVDGYQWLYGPGHSAGLIPTNDGLVCGWVGSPAARFLAEQRRRRDLGFHEVFHRVAPDWAEALRDARSVGHVRGFPGVPGFLRQPWGRGWALVGDAAHFKDPLTTHGMTDALRDAELLARAVLAAASGRCSHDRAMAGYQDTRDALSRPLHALADRVAAYDWDLATVRPLLLAMSAAMRPEVGHLLDLDADAVAS